MNRRKLETLIEKSLYNFVTEIKEHILDYTVLSLRKKDPSLDVEYLRRILETVQMGVDDGYMSKIDRFMRKLSSTLDEMDTETNTERPTVPGKK